MRREFALAEDDSEYLSIIRLEWETIVDGGSKWLIIRGLPILEGYNVPVADAALRIPPSYPDDQIDMVYFHPHLSLASGRAIGALTPHPVEDKVYQQWSRHRTPANPWRPGLDNVGTHLLQVNTWLERELRKAS
jgi:hypothetical protein